ncbi:maleylpyruvate isomerase family mycothiol-dependent enzyme [Streptomyces durbertensis]|uniref:Maleylpyruvate isomerase family mycothiol-dependent enzyme n=1 Tax=Streptomyces durbertensis TaxID=2448886 RepID=A0ABR6E9K2_9ACTN|nr:maleylpyruvate isomerase family mycothiol-dependent enzyme [Streptomyces durbertensis]MBB1242021.1 maleylpyruvate isomerase family mycothiol-dependent enzyme [Streptomyces durbertensis]
MTEHPSLQPYVDAWSHSVDAIAELVGPLPEADWNRRTECPGWSVRDVLSHVIGVESELLGDPRPIHTLPRDLFHVVDEPSRYMEVQVDVRRHHTAPEMTSEFEYILIRRRRQLRNERRGPEATVRSVLPGGGEITMEALLRMRAFDVWVHEQDIRRALRRPGNLDSPGSHIARDILLHSLPKVVAKRAAAPAGTAVVFDVHGPLEFMRTVRVDQDGRGSVNGSPSLGPAVTYSLDWETYLRLACGRVRLDAVRDKVKIEGDEALAEAIMKHFAVTP